MRKTGNREFKLTVTSNYKIEKEKINQFYHLYVLRLKYWGTYTLYDKYSQSSMPVYEWSSQITSLGDPTWIAGPLTKEDNLTSWEFTLTANIPKDNNRYFVNSISYDFVFGNDKDYDFDALNKLQLINNKGTMNNIPFTEPDLGTGLDPIPKPS